MPVEFFLHTPMPDDMNERRAICRVARLLDGRSRWTDDHFILVANIDPYRDAGLRKHRELTQLDGFLLGEKFAAILEFKNYFDPIRVHRLGGNWYAEGVGRQLVTGGSQDNPFFQAKKARQVWSAFLRGESGRFLSPARQRALKKAWTQTSVFLLFHPYLHPDSRIVSPGPDNYWLHISGLEKVQELAYSVPSKELHLTPPEMRALVTEALHAEPWAEMDRLLEREIGHLYVHEPGKTAVCYALHSFEEFTLGRSSKVQGHRVGADLPWVSGHHVRIETDREAAFFYDLHSTNGSFVDGERVAADTAVSLVPSVEVHVGDVGEQALQLWFEPIAPETAAGKTRVTLPPAR